MKKFKKKIIYIKIIKINQNKIKFKKHIINK